MRSSFFHGPSVALASFALVVSACSGASEDVASAPPPAPASTTTEAPPAAPPLAPITFERCSLDTNGNDGRAECANVEVPLDWGAPEGKKVTFFVKRLVGTAPGPHSQLWLLQGGPGGAGDGFEPLASQLAKTHPAFDVYLPDHRGTGRSAFLDCPDTIASSGYPFDYAGCAAEAEKIWGKDGFATFTTTTAARDVGHVIERTRTQGQAVHVYGVSYGTYWAQRYLQLFPTQPTAVTLDSVCGPGLCSYMRIGYWFDRVGKKFLAECAADATCAEKTGGDPASKLKAAIAVADARTCAGLKGFDGAMLKQVMQWFIASVTTRAAIPAIAVRAARCNEDDVVALKTFVSNVRQWVGGGFDGPTSRRDLSSTVLGFHIAFSEMEASPPPSRAELAKMLDGALFTSADPTIYDAFEAWPKYARDEWVGKYPSSPTPLLLMNGTLDPQTPLEFAEEVSKHYTAPKQTYVVVPRSAHGVISQSQTKSRVTCGTQLWDQLLADPSKPIDTSCTEAVLPHDFSDAQPLAMQMFGTGSLWGAATAAPAIARPGAVPSSAIVATPAMLRTELEQAMQATTPWVPVVVTKRAFARAIAREASR